MAFDIRLLSETEPGSELGNTGLHGRITLGDYRETFIALIGFWSPRDYEEHWIRSVRRVVERRETSCLITSLHDPAASDMLWWWPLYVRHERVVVQNSILLLRELPRPFSLRDPYASVPPYRDRNEDGYPISEWTLPLTDLRAFLATR